MFLVCSFFGWNVIPCSALCLQAVEHSVKHISCSDPPDFHSPNEILFLDFYDILISNSNMHVHVQTSFTLRPWKLRERKLLFSSFYSCDLDTVGSEDMKECMKTLECIKNISLFTLILNLRTLSWWLEIMCNVYCIGKES